MILSNMLWDRAVQFYNQTFVENADPRVDDYPLMQSPFPTLIICLSYVYIVKYLGPNLMKNREPLDIRWLMVTYNFTMMVVCFLIFYNFGVNGWFGTYSYRCQPVDFSNSPQALGMVHVSWWFYISKFIEFIDTFFFVMRKKYSQVSTLHVVHHGILPMSVWFGVKFCPGGHSTFFAFVNSFVHVLMYFYYGLAAIGPQMNKYLWWKKYMTTVQMVQFIMIFAHAFQLLFRNCNYPQSFVYFIGMHAVLFWFLFYDFYTKAYKKSKSPAKVSKAVLDAKEASFQQVKNGYKIQNGYNHLSGFENNVSQNGVSNNSHPADISVLSSGHLSQSEVLENKAEKKVN